MITGLPTPPRAFRHVPGFPGYAVNRKGKVISCWAPGHHTKRIQGWHRMRPVRRKARGAFKRKARYYFIRVSSFGPNGRTRRGVQIHRMVLLAFVGPCPRGLEACHNNGRHTDNRLKNLRWDTSAANRADQVVHGALAIGEKQWMARLTAAAVRYIRTSGKSIGELAHKYRVDSETVRDALKRRTWKHVS